MSAPILATKLFLPPPRLKAVPRPRLIERLNEGISSNHKLTLISAPAGFGKTTLVSEWAAGCGKPVAWLSLNEGDNDPARFMAYLTAALQTLGTNVGKGAMGMLQGSQSPPNEAVLTTLLNEITTIPHHFLLVLDDYHLIDSQPVDQSLTFLLDHLPPQMHLVIITREDPTLPLARLRARNQLTELRATDLRFSPSESAEFLNAVMGLNLSAEDIAALEARTEGWITGLQLAAISMQGRADTTNFIKAFTGSHRFVLDYLVEEVLQRQPEHIHGFLLQTSILDRLSGPLCDAVTGQEDGKGMLEALERGNFFVVPLDENRQWYRYHHLFAEVLQAHLMETQPDQVSSLHRQASTWYEQNDLPSDAIHHALAAEDFERTAGLIERTYPIMDNSFQSTVWLSWVKALPDELIRDRPVLSVDYAWALTDLGELEASESRLQDAERWLEPEKQPERCAGRMVVVDNEQFRSLPAKIAQARAYHAMAQGDIPGTIKYAELVFDLCPEEDQMMRAGTTVQLGMAYWANGDLDAAHKAMTEWVNHNQRTGNILFMIASTFVLADIRVAQGRLREAIRTYQQALRLATEYDQPADHITAPLYLGLALLYHETGEQDAAAQHLKKSAELGDQTTLVDWPCRWRLAQARFKEAEGDPEAALELLDEAKRVYVRNPIPDLYPIEASKARVYVRQGRLSEALSWVHSRGLSVDDELSYLGEFEHITLARVLYLRDQAATSAYEACALLDRLLKAAEEGARQGSVIEILALKALTQQAQNNLPQARASLERALRLAKPEGYIRLFVDEGEAMRLLILDFRLWLDQQSHEQKHQLIDYADRLLSEFTKPAATAHSKVNDAQFTMIEPLSQRELEVLQLISQGLSNSEISERLFLSLSTVKGHNYVIFDKLQVQRRTEAVARARELGLL